MVIQQKTGLHSKDGLYGGLRDAVHKAEEQGATSEEINRNITVISNIAKNNLENTREFVASSEGIVATADDLKTMIQQFK